MSKLKLHIILVLALWLVFSGVAAAEQLYVNESGWWRDGGVFNASGTPIQAAVGAAEEGDLIYVWNGTYYEDGGVSITKERITLQGEDVNTTTVHGKWAAMNVVHVTGDYVNVSGFTVAGSTSGGSGICVVSNNCLVSNNIANSNDYGISLFYSSNNTITNNIIADSNSCSIRLSCSSNNTIANNIANAENHGIDLYHSSNNTITNNIANSNYNHGIYLDSSSNNTIANNNIVNSNHYGIYLQHSSANHIIGNTADANRYGIYLRLTSTNNNITGNTIQNNREYGMYLDYSGNNEIYHNIFIDNNKQAYDHHGFNEWDKGSIIGGNYWSDHVCHGNPSNGTEPYTGIDTDAGSVDNYPFEEPDGWVTKNQPPIANFTYIPLNPIINQTVTFNASNSADLDGAIINYKWDFGDGNTTNTTEEIITYFYTSAEDYTVNLTVTDDEGATNSTSKVITVYPPTIIYVPDDYAKIQWAVDNATAGDTIFVWNGSYNENVNVYKRLTLEGAGADVVTVTAVDSGDHIFAVTADYVNISGFAVRGATDNDMAGIRLTNADYCNISENNVYGNYRGIFLSSSSNNTLTSNTASNNRYGILLYPSSNNNTLTSNTVNSNNNYGIWLYSSSNNTLTSNTVNSNNNCGIALSSSSNNTLTSNTVNSNNWCTGISMSSSSNNTLTNNTASNNRYGIILDYSSNNTLTSNTANSNNNYGIYLSSSSNNTLTSNNCSNNNCGINLGYAGDNVITCNWVQSNIQSGFRLDNADNNNITCNWVHHNTQYGFYLSSGSTGNNINYNNIIENGNYNTVTGGWEWQFYMGQYQPVEAKHNYWGAGMNSSTIDASIYDDEEGWGEVEFNPFETEPVPCAPTPEESHTFTTTDAVIALQIAAGSRPPDLRWDVSGDGSVTSLDALMILQAAAGSIEVG